MAFRRGCEYLNNLRSSNGSLSDSEETFTTTVWGISNVKGSHNAFSSPVEWSLMLVSHFIDTKLPPTLFFFLFLDRGGRMIISWCVMNVLLSSQFFVFTLKFKSLRIGVHLMSPLLLLTLHPWPPRVPAASNRVKNASISLSLSRKRVTISLTKKRKNDEACPSSQLSFMVSYVGYSNCWCALK